MSGHRRGLLAALAILALLAALAVLFSAARSLDTSRFAAQVEDIRGLQRLDAELVRDLLRLRAGLLGDYDSVDASLSGMRAALARLRGGTAAFPQALRPGVATGIDKVSYALETHERAIDDFKSDNAVLRTSALYLSLHAQRLTDLVGQEQRLAPLGRQLALFVNRMLQFQRNPSPQSAQGLAEQIAQLRALAVPAAHQDAVDALRVQGNLVLERTQRIDALLRGSGRTLLAQSIIDLEGVHGHARQAVIEQAQRYWSAIAALALLLLLYAAYMVWRLRAATQRVADSEARFHRALQGANDGLFDWHIPSNQVYYSPRWKAMLGYGEAELANAFATWEGLVEPEGRQRTLAMVQEYIEGRRNNLVIEFRMRHKDGHWVDILARGYLQRDAAGKPLRLTGTHVDITERKRAEAQIRALNEDLEQRVADRTRELTTANAQLKSALATLEHARDELVRSEKLASLGSLVAGVAHELNTPLGNSLTVATSLTERVREFNREMAAGPLRRSSLERFLQAADSASDMIVRNLYRAGDLISHFKQVAVDQTSAQRRPFDLAEVIGEVALTLQPQFKKTPHRVAVEVPTGLAMDSYPGPLGQVVTNLVSNALVHGFEDTAAGVVRITAEPRGQEVILTVADNGRGIPEAHQAKVFDPFFTTRMGQGGSGLGLHIVYSLVTRVLGGRLYLASQPGEGTTVSVHLPRVAPQQDGLQTGASMAVRAG